MTQIPTAMPPAQPGAPMMRPHRGGMLLAFAILGWLVCAIFSIVAYFMAAADMKEIDAGRMDPEGRGLTQASKIIALIQLILLVLVIVVFGAIMLLGVIAAGASAASGAGP
ncbi:MAG: hypothetical protein AAF432_06015 [Planctomycetota bacterium]